MEKQTLLLVDENDAFLGYEDRLICHTGEGKKHRGFVTLLLDKDNNVLLQKRKHILFDDLWDFTVISHPIKTEAGDESYQQASDRSLMREMGIGPVPVENHGGFSYFAPHNDLCENEYCAVLVGHYDGDNTPNPDCVYEVKKMSLEEFINDAKTNSSIYTPWAILAIPFIEKLRA